MKQKSDVLCFVMLMFVVVPLEVLCAALAYETLGEITSRLYFMLVALLNLAILVVALRYRVAAAMAAFVLALAIIPYQLILADRLLHVQAEATHIVAYVYDYRASHGQYPADLTDYKFRDPNMKTFIQSYRRDDAMGGFAVFYRVGTESTSHYYSPASGWGYYPD